MIVWCQIMNDVGLKLHSQVIVIKANLFFLVLNKKCFFTGGTMESCFLLVCWAESSPKEAHVDLVVVIMVGELSL